MPHMPGPEKSDLRVKFKQDHIQVCTRRGDDRLNIELKRTFRVADNENASDLPPDLGNHTLHKVKDHIATLPENIAEKGGCFLSMHRKSHLTPTKP